MRLRSILMTLCLSVFLVSYGQKRLIILHTNDTHSRIEPLPETDKSYPNMGGVVNRKAVIDSIRSAEDNVLLIDAGDFVQGTPYFNLFHGRVEAGALNLLGYEVGTLGNHEFDYGLDTLRNIIKKLKYPIVNCNYDFTHTPLRGLIKPYTIINKNGIKIGVIGVGVDPEGLIQQDKYEGMKFKPIIERVNYYSNILKDKCDIIICLSHCGLIDDLLLASQSNNIDIIIGGHSHTFMEMPEIRKNKDNKDVLIYQVGKNGAFIGKVELELSPIKSN